MQKKIFLTLIISFILIIQSCDDSVNSPQYYIAGTVTFTDTHLSTGQGYYAVSVYADTSQPYQRAPIISDSLTITVAGNVATANYRIENVPAGTFHVGTTWICTQTGNIRGVLGIYGCDTAVNCMGTHVGIPNYSGTNDINFLSWTDTLKRLY